MSHDQSTVNRSNRRVLLLIDDEPDMVEVMFTILDSRNTHVLLALDGTEALKLLKTQPIDAVLTDIRMPEMSGVELVKKIRELGLPTPVVMMTGFADLETALEAMRAGVLDLVEKPFSRQKMVGTLNTALDLGMSIRRIHGELKAFFGSRRETGADAELFLQLSTYLARQELDRIQGSVKSAA